MPSFSLGVQQQSARQFSIAAQETKANVLLKANSVLAAAKAAGAKELSGPPCLIELANYLEKRMGERHLFSDDTIQLSKRAAFIENLLKSEMPKRLQLLDEKNIIVFKGFFTQRLYDALVNYRQALQEDLIKMPSMTPNY